MNTFIFDLDGTLLPMPSQELFLETYFGALTKKFEPQGYEPKSFAKAVMYGTQAMLENDGAMTNEKRFWKVFGSVMGEQAQQLEDEFEEFYQNEFNEARRTTFTHPHAKECIRLLKQKGYTVALATNPVFPRIATYTRMGWADIDPKDFDLITTYENSSYCKPRLEYYKEVLAGIGKEPRECIMVGNDVTEDMCALTLGMDTYLLKDCLISPEQEDLSIFKQGGFDDLLAFIKELPEVSSYS